MIYNQFFNLIWTLILKNIKTKQESTLIEVKDNGHKVIIKKVLSLLGINILKKGVDIYNYLIG